MNTFNKEERLCSKKSLDLLFKNGSSFLLYPFRVTYFQVDEPWQYPVKVVINVPKKRFKRAVDRNLLKRRIRETYRHLKSDHLYSFFDTETNLLLLSLQFVGKDKYPSEFLEKKLEKTLKKLTSILENETH